MELNLKTWKINQEERNRNRMKLTLKLSALDADAYKNFKEAFKPNEMTDEDFLKTLFFYGVKGMQEEFKKNIDDRIKNDPEFAKQVEEAKTKLQQLEQGESDEPALD